MATGLMVNIAMNTAQMAQDVQQVKTLVRGMHTDMERSSSSMIDKLNKNWIGWTMKIYMAEKAIRMLGQSFGTLYQPVEEFNLSVTQMAAQITNMMEKTKTTDIAAQYQEAKTYATDLARAMEKIDQETVATAKDLRAMNEQMITGGQLLDIYNPKELEAFKNVANAVAVVASQFQNKEVQVRQEIRTLMQGEVKTTNILATQLQGMVSGPLEEHVKKHKEAGDLIQWMGELLKGYSAASQDIESTWAAIGTSLKTTWDIIARTGFSSGYMEINTALKEMNDWLRKNGDTIANWVNMGWELMKGLILIAKDSVMVFKDEIIAAGYATLWLLEGVLKIAEAIPNTMKGIKNIGEFFMEGWKGSGGAIAGMLNFDAGWEQAQASGERMWELMWMTNDKTTEKYFVVLRQRLENILNPPDMSAYDITGWMGGSSGTKPKIKGAAEEDKGAKKRESEFKSMREALDRFTDSVAKANPMLSDLDKKLWAISDDAEDLARKLGDMTHLTDAQWESFAQGILDTEALAEEYALLSHEMGVQKIMQEGLLKDLEKEKAQRQSLIDTMDLQAKAAIDIRNNSQLGKVKEKEKYGLANRGDVLKEEFQGRQRLIEQAKIKYEADLQQMTTDEELAGMKERAVELQNMQTASLQQYIDAAASYDVAYSIWAQEHEALVTFAEAWGLTQEEMVTGTVDLWTDMGDLVSDLSQQMANSLTNVLTGLISGTVDVKKAMTSLVSSMLSSIVGMLIKIGMQYLITAMIGRGIQAASTAAQVAAGMAITAAMTPAAIMASIATFGAADIAGMTGFSIALAGMGAEAAGLIGMFAGLGAAGVAMAEGGLINERVVGRGMRSGQMYEIGEAGPEYVVPANKMGGGGGVTIVINGDVLNSHDELARKLIPAFRKAAQDGVR